MTDSYRSLLRKFSSYIRRAGATAAASIALRTRSTSLRDVIAFVATYDTLTADQLRAHIFGESKRRVEFRYDWLATFGRVVALQAYQARDHAEFEESVIYGLSCLHLANRQLPNASDYQQYHRLEVELLMHVGDLDQASHLIKGNPFLKDRYYGYLETDLSNPWVSGTEATYEQWIEGFNRPYRENELVGVRTSSFLPVFNDLTAVPVEILREGPKVSVIMTTYKPQAEELQLAVRSILDQSWQNLELIIVDDASPDEFETTLREISELDSRVRLVKLSRNGGTYRARNEGLSLAAGEFVTGQDSDDWSHPQRIAMQIEHMLSEPCASGVVVEAIRADEHLVRTFPGRIPERPCEVSLMLRKSLADELGGYVDARKGADSEYRFRLETYTGREVGSIPKPLYLTRVGHESLSGADFKPGWSHPVRRSFWNATRYWHAGAERTELQRTKETTWEPIPIPNRFKVILPSSPPHFDVVFVDDWRTYGGRQRALLDAINTHLEAGDKVGILHLESVLSPSKETTRLTREVQALINDRRIAEIIPDEHATSDLVVIRDPVIVQFSPTDGINLSSGTILMTPDLPPYFPGTDHVLYDLVSCSAITSKIFNGSVLWTSEDPAIYDQLKMHCRKIEVHPQRLPLVFLPERWMNRRPKLVYESPVLGRHGENYEEVWPENLQAVEQLWPLNGTADIRILGDVRGFMRKQEEHVEDPDWLVFRREDIQPEAFMSGLDFFIYFPQRAFAQSLCREALEAVAAGAVAILPQTFSPVHGDGALYAEPAEVPGLVSNLSRNRESLLAANREQRASLDRIINNEEYLNYTRPFCSQAQLGGSSKPGEACV